MTDEQMQVLTITQQVLKAVTTTLLAMNPAEIPRIARALQAFAGAPGIEPMAKEMIANIAQGVAVLAAARAPKQ